MPRVVMLLVTEAGALILMLFLGVDLPWADPVWTWPEEVVAGALLFLAAIGGVSWLLLSTLTYVLSFRSPRARHFAGRLTAPLIRRVVDTSLAATLSFGAGAPSLAAEAPPEPIIITVSETEAGPVLVPPGVTIPVSPSPTMAPAEVDAPQPALPGTKTAAPREATMFPEITTSREASGLEEITVMPGLTTTATGTPPAESRATAGGTYEVRRGDHLWSIAERILESETGASTLADHEIAPYWRALIDANAATLSSGDPDLIYPGEILDLPEVKK